MSQTITVENMVEAFDLLLQLGAGSKGQVWLARSPGHPTGLLAVKLFHPGGRLNSAGGRRWESLGDHPNVVRVLEAQWSGPQPFLAMEYVDGPSLRIILDMSRGQCIPLPVSMHILRGVLHALVHAHTRAAPGPVVHGALSPDSILVDANTGAARLDDFGMGPGDGLPDTVRGRVMDRLRHLAPEQIAGRPATDQTDLYATGILLHELLFGVGPFEHLPMLSLLSPDTRTTAFALSDLPPGTPVGLLDVLRRALARDKADRFCTAREMLAALHPYMPAWQEGARQVAAFTRQLARHAADAIASVEQPTAIPHHAPFERAWEPSLGDASEQEDTEPFIDLTPFHQTQERQP